MREGRQQQEVWQSVVFNLGMPVTGTTNNGCQLVGWLACCHSHAATPASEKADYTLPDALVRAMTSGIFQ